MIFSWSFASMFCFQLLQPNCHIVKPVVNPIVYDQKATFTAYNAVPEQTDSTPCITASGYNICDQETLPKIVASNKYKFGTILDIEGFGRYTVEDRTATKYKDRIDMLFETYEGAINFGKRELNYKVIN